MGRKKRQRRLLVEGLEQRRLLAVMTDLPTAPAPDLEEFTEPRNIGTVQAANYTETETTGETGENDSIFNAEFVNLGNGAGQEDTIDITGSLPLRSTTSPVTGPRADIDTFEVHLKAGDILDIATLGAAGGLTVQHSDGSIWFGTDLNSGVLYPDDSPLQNQGNNVGAQVVPEDGTYYISVAPINDLQNYTLGLRTYRPVSEQLATGDSPIVFLDFDGGFIDANVFNQQFGPLVPVPGVVRFHGFDDSLPLFGVERGDIDARNEFIDIVIDKFTQVFNDVAADGTNGDFSDTNNPGDYGIRLLNSRDHGGLISEEDPRVTRLLIGGTNVDFGTGAPLFGVSETLDVGNFDLSELIAMPLELYLPAVQAIPLSPTASLLEATSTFLGAVAAHEFAHNVGLWHTDTTNTISTLIDAGGPNAVPNALGVGPDGIYGTLDDVESKFRDDFFSPAEFFFGIEEVPETLSHVLSTGTQGGSITGRVFSDEDGDGKRDTGEGGVAGVTVFIDRNGNGTLDAGEASDTTAASGRYSLNAAAGTYKIVAQVPADFVASTPRTRSASVSNGSATSGVDFGMRPITPEITGKISGTKFFDENENGEFDDGEAGIAGVYVYLDLDDDNRLDLGEPRDTTDEDGNYSITPPRSGTFTVREVIQPGFVQTFPEDGEHEVVFDGTGLPDNDFGNFQARDFSDAPASYGSPSHGITEGIMLGTQIDREDGPIPTAGADGDDNNGIDDEDALEILTPLAAGEGGDVAVTVTNTSGTGFLQAWVDFNQNGTFDSSERIISDRVLGTGRHELELDGSDIPASVEPGEYYARLRYSQTPGLAPTGEADSGEVEDYLVTIRGDADVAADDRFFVTRNSINNELDVLENDFQTPDNPLTIVDQDLSGTLGAVSRSSDNQSFIYTPPSGFLGTDSFTYTVQDQFGTQSTAEVIINVSFLSDEPIAVDDAFTIPDGSTNHVLDVLDNDLASTEGGLTITGVGPSTAGGTVEFTGQQIVYSVPNDPDFNGTDQFTYTVEDPAGSESTATVTINTLVGSREDDLVEFSLELTDTVNDNPINAIQVGEKFRLTVSVDDVEDGQPQGIASAFLDVLYDNSLVVVDQSADIQFGPLFGDGPVTNVDFDVPGVIDETGSNQNDLTNLVEHDGPTTLFTVTLEAIAPGEARFKADPAEDTLSETIVIGSDSVVEPHEMRLGQTMLNIRDASNNFPSAIDDSYPLTFDASGDQTAAVDSNGNPITPGAGAPNVLRVLDNDRFGPSGTITELTIDVDPEHGTIRVDNNGTPNDVTDDFIEYDPFESGFDSFTYSIVSGDGVRSTAEVTLNSGLADPSDLLVHMGLEFVDTSGNPISSAGIGETVGLRVDVDDLRDTNETFVYAAFLDVLYDSDILTPIQDSSRLGFDVDFGPFFDPDAATGFIDRPGIIDEFGTNDVRSSVSGDEGGDPRELATIFFTATAAGTANATGSPADRFPFRDTLLFGRDTEVPVDQIVFDTAQLTVGGGEGESLLQNTALPPDVNNDSHVTAMDALLVINELSRSGEAEGEAIGSPRYFTDVNGDKRVTALDALQVINALTRGVGGEGELAEGEAVVPAQQAQDGDSSTLQASVQADAVFADFDADSKDAAGRSASQPAGLSASGSLVAPAPAERAGEEDEEDDDVLNLLADDVAQLWA